MTALKEKNRWRYERGEGRHKHIWNKRFAGFVPADRGQVGKCPCDVTLKDAEAALNQGEPVRPCEGEPFPGRIFTVLRGVIYEAVPTTPGESYHAYPWRGDLPGRPRIPSRILKKLAEKARAAGFESEFKKWLKRYGG